MVKPTLLVLAAGMGSRYGSLKQMDGVGPNNEAIIDYSVYDAIRAGFGKVVFVIRHSFEKEFREVFSAERFGGRIAVEFVFQELDYLPEGASVPEGRVKPWGTNHAVMMAADAVHEPFAVINADDFYGADEELAEDTPVSMNLFGFTPDFFAYSKEYFKTWLAENRENLKSEFYIPTMVNKLIGEGAASLRVLRSAAQWHGVTYKEDKPALMASIEKMIAEGKYPRNLWA